MRSIIVDYGMGNLRSVQHKLKKLEIETEISSSPDAVANADVLILPGIGNFAKGMANLQEYGLIPILNEKVMQEKVPLLGICLGMQLITRWSEEGDAAGLGWIDAETKRFDFQRLERQPRIPHIGWNRIQPVRAHAWLTGIGMEQRFYFVHSYHVVCRESDMVLATTDYGSEFVSVVQQENIYAAQFHPEKSHADGMQLLRNFFEKVVREEPVRATI